jgi:hypothetical protein
VGVSVGVAVNVGGTVVSVGVGVLDGVNVILGIGVAVKRGVNDTIGPNVRVGRPRTGSFCAPDGEGVSVFTSSHAANSTTLITNNHKHLRIIRLKPLPKATGVKTCSA